MVGIKGMKNKGQFKKGSIPWNKGINCWEGKIHPKGMLGKENKWGHHNKKTKQKISNKLNGRKLNTTHKENISETNKIKMQKIIHHINGNHNDNRPENRMIMTQSEHIKLHIKQRDVHPWDYIKINTGGNLEL